MELALLPRVRAAALLALALTGLCSAQYSPQLTSQLPSVHPQCVDLQPILELADMYERMAQLDALLGERDCEILHGYMWLTPGADIGYGGELFMVGVDSDTSVYDDALGRMVHYKSGDDRPSANPRWDRIASCPWTGPTTRTLPPRVQPVLQYLCDCGAETVTKATMVLRRLHGCLEYAYVLNATREPVLDKAWPAMGMVPPAEFFADVAACRFDRVAARNCALPDGSLPAIPDSDYLLDVAPSHPSFALAPEATLELLSIHPRCLAALEAGLLEGLAGPEALVARASVAASSALRARCPQHHAAASEFANSDAGSAGTCPWTSLGSALQPLPSATSKALCECGAEALDAYVRDTSVAAMCGAYMGVWNVSAAPGQTEAALGAAGLPAPDEFFAQIDDCNVRGTLGQVGCGSEVGATSAPTASAARALEAALGAVHEDCPAVFQDVLTEDAASGPDAAGAVAKAAMELSWASFVAGCGKEAAATVAAALGSPRAASGDLLTPDADYRLAAANASGGGGGAGPGPAWCPWGSGAAAQAAPASAAGLVSAVCYCGAGAVERYWRATAAAEVCAAGAAAGAAGEAAPAVPRALFEDPGACSAGAVTAFCPTPAPTTPPTAKVNAPTKSPTRAVGSNSAPEVTPSPTEADEGEESESESSKNAGSRGAASLFASVLVVLACAMRQCVESSV